MTDEGVVRDEESRTDARKQLIFNKPQQIDAIVTQNERVFLTIAILNHYQDYDTIIYNT
jgi:hypothetical protein